MTLLLKLCSTCSDQPPPERALYIRVVTAELERLHSHLLWAGVAAKLIGFKTMFMSCFAIREIILNALEAISGKRVNYAMNCVGGVNRDLPDPSLVLRAVDAMEKEISRSIIPIFTTNRIVKTRCNGIGVLTTEQALSCGVVGPVS